jgi:OmpA-OmpF porin, OOP family
MKKNLLILFLVVAGFISTAQNLVLNPSLENYITCPGFGQFSNIYINNWTKPSYGSTDYYNANCTGIQPVSQVPHTGEAYFGIIAFNYSGEYREYATGQLSSTLAAGVPYIVTFYVSLHDGYIQAVNELGAYLSAAMPGPFGNALHIAVTPQIENTTGVLGSDSTWMIITGSFIATGGEQYITIGNFHDDAGTTVTQVGSVGSYGAYYFVDDVSVKSQETGIESENGTAVAVYPNPMTNSMHIALAKPGYAEITFYDMALRKIMSRDFISSVSLNTGCLAAGLYIYEVRSNGGVITQGKIVKE